MTDPTVLVAAITGVSLVAAAAVTGLLARSGRGRDEAVEERLQLQQEALQAILRELKDIEDDPDEQEPPPTPRRSHRAP